MKKLLVATAIALSTFGFAETEAATVSVDNAEVVEMGTWTKVRDHITGKRERERERERWEERDRWEREHRPPPHRPGYGPPPPDRPGYGPPPPPHRPGYGPPPPPPNGHRQPPPPPHHRR